MPGQEGILDRFPRERHWLLPALQAVQHARGHLSADALAEVAAHLRVPASEVYGVATDYPELRLGAGGRHRVRVCTGVTCTLLGGRGLLARLEQRVRDDGRVDASGLTVEAADCFFECSVAPLVEVDGEYRGRVTAGDVTRLDEWFAERTDEEPAGIFPVAPAVPASGAAGSARLALEDLEAAARREQRARPALRIHVQAGTCGRAVGADAVAAAVRSTLGERALPAAVIAGACNGMCYAAPVVEVERAGWPGFLLERVTPAAVPALLKVLTDDRTSFESIPGSGLVWADAPWRGLVPVATHPFWAGQERVLLRRAGSIDPESLDDALLSGSYRALARALDGAPEDVIAAVKAAGLQGRGGAFFPAAVKWEACRKAAGRPKYLVMNGEEGEPGIFKDRHLMEADPHEVLEGALLAAYAAGATRVILYVHGEADLSAARLARAVRDAAAAGIIGGRMLGRDVECTVELRRGGGGFVLGEETALLESIEGRRAQPRTRPPFPVESGLWGRPTVINNVETLAAVPAILEGGPERFVALGTATAPGTKVFGLSGPLRRPGVVEVRNGVTLAALLQEIAGGLADGRPLLGAVVGGPSGSIVPASLFHEPMEPRGRVSPGTGGIVGLPESTSVVDVVKILLAFNAAESCGKCTPCREGAPRLLGLVDELGATADPEGVHARIRELAEAMQSASLCGLGQAAPLSLVRALQDFGAQFRR